MKKSVISYLYHIPQVEGEAYDPAPFSFRMHDVDRSMNAEQILEQVMRERSPIPAECGVEVYQ
jgi:hypothetical protein